MLDNPEKTTRLLTALKAAAPFEVEVLPSVVKHLQSENLTIPCAALDCPERMRRRCPS
jgi:hypothetical protein